MMRTELPIPRAFRALQDVVYPLRINETEALTFTLTWGSCSPHGASWPRFRSFQAR